MKKVLKINIRWAHDEHADVSHLETSPESHYGEDGANWAHVGPEQLAKVEAEFGSVWGACEAYARQDAARLAAFHAGDWHMQGCWAKAEVVVNGVCQRIGSGGLWGIESDSSETYRREVEEEQRAQLLEILATLGFDVAAEVKAEVTA